MFYIVLREKKFKFHIIVDKIDAFSELFCQ